MESRVIPESETNFSAAPPKELAKIIDIADFRRKKEQTLSQGNWYWLSDKVPAQTRLYADRYYRLNHSGPYAPNASRISELSVEESVTFNESESNLPVLGAAD